MQTKDVDYYNKEIIKRKQRDNKDVREIHVSSISSLALVAVAPQVSPEDLSLCQEEAEQDFSHSQYQAPTSPRDLIKEQMIKRALVQYYVNEGSQTLQKKKLKVRLNIDLGQGQGVENVDFIAALTTDLGNFKKYHPEESRQEIQAWADQCRRDIQAQWQCKPQLGKLHMSRGWRANKSQVNQIEPWTAVLVWYAPEQRRYYAWVKIYEWEEILELTNDTITDKQAKTNLKAQKLWHNPRHLQLVRPQTWAQQRGLV